MTNAKMITSNTHGDYFFIENFDHEIKIEIGGKKYYGSFKTGHSYDYNDYSMPSNQVEAYAHDEILSALDSCGGDYDDFINESELQITQAEFEKIYDQIIELRHEAQDIVDQHIRDAEETLENDTNYYVLITPFETVEGWDDENGVKVSEQRQCGIDYVEKFATEHEADESVETEIESGNMACICTKEQAYEIENR